MNREPHRTRSLARKARQHLAPPEKAKGPTAGPSSKLGEMGKSGFVPHLPISQILVETDAPFLAPEPKRGKTNEPGFVGYTAKVVAEVRGVMPEEIAQATTENFFRLFQKVPRSLHPGEGG